MFDPQTELPLNHSNPSDRNHFSYDSYGARIKKTVQKYDTYRSWNHNNGSGGGGVCFSGDDGNDEESGVCSPPLWKTSSPNHHHNQQQQQQNNYRYLSPAQKSQAVAKGQRELMEMIRNMPESSYELSLKDIVEYPRIEARHESVPREKLSDVTSFDDEVVLNLKDEKDEEEKKKKKSGKKKGQQATMRRSESIDSGGFLLKMVFPFPWGSSNNKKMMMKKKKTNNNVTSTCSKVSPRPSTSDKSKILDGSEKSVVDKEWWKKKRLSNSRDSESGGMSSINSGSTGSSGSSSSTRSNSNSNSNINNGRNRRIFSSGCWSFFHINKGKNHK